MGESAAFASARPTIRLAGEVRADVQDALSAMVVNLPLSGMAHAELQLRNFGPGENGSPAMLFEAIGLGEEIEIAIGADRAQTIFRGEVTALEERYGEGAPQLVLLLQDKLHRLARQRRSRLFEDQSVDDVVRAVAGAAGLQADVSASPASANYHQLNESDLAFLLRLLGPLDIALRLDGRTLRARPEEPDAEPVLVDPQDNALRVRLIADLNHQAVSTAVRGFNAASDQSVSAAVDALPSPPAGTIAGQLLGELGWAGEEVVAQPFARSQAEASAYAHGHFKRQAKRFVSGELRMLGEPGLRSGREIELAGVSERLRGIYQVVHCVHRFDNEAGFETDLKVNRADWQA